MPENGLDLEQLAAFVEGRLSGEARRRVLKLLAESDEAYEVFVDTVRFRAEEGLEEERLAARVPSRVWRWAGIPLAAAAAAVLVLATPLIRTLRPPDLPQFTTDQLIGSLGGAGALPGALGPGWDQRAWSVTRGAGARLAEPAVAFRLGVRTVDLRIALQSPGAGDADRLISEILALLSDVELSQPVAAQYAQLRSQVAAGGDTAPLPSAAAAAEAALKALLQSPRFSVGQWCAAAELAARAENASFFRSTATRSFFDVVDRLGLDAADLDALQRIATLSGDGLDHAEVLEVQELLRDLIRRSAG